MKMEKVTTRSVSHHTTFEKKKERIHGLLQKAEMAKTLKIFIIVCVAVQKRLHIFPSTYEIKNKECQVLTQLNQVLGSWRIYPGAFEL